jgi:hypothetical protein
VKKNVSAVYNFLTNLLGDKMTTIHNAFQKFYTLIYQKELPNNICYRWNNTLPHRFFCDEVHENDNQLGCVGDYHTDSLRAKVVDQWDRPVSVIADKSGNRLPFLEGVKKIEEIAKSPTLFLAELMTCAENKKTGKTITCARTTGPISPQVFLEALEIPGPHRKV